MSVGGAIASNRIRHAGQPDLCQCLRHMPRLEFVPALTPKEFLDEKVIHNHAEKPSCGQPRVCFAEGALAYARPNVSGEGVKIFRNEGVKRARRKFMIFKGREPQQPRELAVAFRACKELAGHGLEHFSVGATQFQDALDAVAPATRIAELLNQSPVEVFFAGKMPEQESFIDAGLFCNLPSRRSLVTVARKHSRGDLKDLLAAVGR